MYLKCKGLHYAYLISSSYRKLFVIVIKYDVIIKIKTPGVEIIIYNIEEMYVISLISLLLYLLQLSFYLRFTTF